MRHRNLSIDQAPPFGIPARFFLTAPLLGIAAVVMTLVAGPDILQQRWLPWTIAVTHLLTLGFITMSMIGAMFQLLPVLAGASIYRARLVSSLVHLLFTSGVILLTLGLYTGHGLLLKLALFTLLPGLLLFLVTASISIFRVNTRVPSITGMRLALIALWITTILGGILASGHSLEHVPLLRQHTNTHLVWGMAGWVSIMIMAVAYQVIPMFQVTDEYPDIIRKYLAPALFIALFCWSLAHWLGYDREWLDLAIITVSSLLFIVFFSTSLYLLYQRRKRITDPSLYFWIFGLLMLAFSLLILSFGSITHSQVGLLATVMFILGFVISIINAMLYKILPFLVWLHLSQRPSPGGLSGIPTMNDIIPMKQAYRQFYLYVIAVILLPAAIFYPSLFFYPVLGLIFISWLLLQWNLTQAALLYFRQHA